MVTAAFLTAKILDIGLVTTYYFMAAFFLAWLVDYWYGPFDEKQHEERSTLLLILEAIGKFFVIGVLVYFVRNLVERIPYPLEGLGGFQHARLKEVDEAFVFLTVFVFYQDHLADTLKYLMARINGHVVGKGVVF